MGEYETEHESSSDRTDDRALAAAAQRGSLPAFCRIVERYEHRIFNFLLRRVGSRPDAEDLTQETFLRAWQHIHRYNARHELRAWLFTIAARLTSNHLRRRRPPLPHPLSDDAAVAATQPAADVVSAHDEQQHIWRSAGRLLSPKQVTLLWLRYAEQLSDRDIARVMGMTRIAVRVSIHRSLDRLCEHHRIEPSSPSTAALASSRMIAQVST